MKYSCLLSLPLSLLLLSCSAGSSVNPSSSVNPDSTSGIDTESKEAAQAVIDKLYEIDSKVKSGINVTNYSTVVADAAVQVDKLERQQSTVLKSVFADIKSAYEHYGYAKDVWNCSVTNEASNNGFIFGICYRTYKDVLIKEYGVVEDVFPAQNGIFVSSAVSKIWEKARTSLQSAEKALD